MIDEKLRKDRREKSQKNNTEENKTIENKGRKFTIALLSTDELPKGIGLPPGKNNAAAIVYRECVVIYYEPVEDTIEGTRKLRIFIAHELGHVLMHYKVIHSNDDLENYANLFAYFAISGKNKFYQERVVDILYRGGEEEIIRSINEVYPTTDRRDTNRDHLQVEPV